MTSWRAADQEGELVFLAALSGDREPLYFFYRLGGAATILSYCITAQAYEAANFSEPGVLL